MHCSDHPAAAEPPSGILPGSVRPRCRRPPGVRCPLGPRAGLFTQLSTRIQFLQAPQRREFLTYPFSGFLPFVQSQLCKATRNRF